MVKKEKKEQFVFLFTFAVLSFAVLFLFQGFSFTGFVTYEPTGIITDSFSTEDFLLENSSGIYLSEIFGNGSEILWNNFIFFSEDENVSFSVRGCDDVECDTEEFFSFSDNITSSYFQFKAETFVQENDSFSYSVSINYFFVIDNESEENLSITEDLNETENLTFCGDGIIQIPNDEGVNESCDEGDNNGFVCSADYGGSCVYCSLTCEEVVIYGATCGDGDCNSGESCSNCESDCGVCEVESTITPDSVTNQVQTTSTSESYSCIPNIVCGEWGECINETQIRICKDSNKCSKLETTETQDCVLEIPETCFDGIKNQDEKGIDCGGVCEQKCNFLTIVGSAINEQINAGKEFFVYEIIGDKTKIIIFSSLVGLIIIGFFTARFFIKKKKDMKKLDKIIDNLSK